MSVEHEFNVSAGCRTTQSRQTTMPFTDALVDERNSLPADVTSSPSLPTFQRRLKTELFARSYS